MSSVLEADATWYPPRRRPGDPSGAGIGALRESLCNKQAGLSSRSAVETEAQNAKTGLELLQSSHPDGPVPVMGGTAD